MSMPFTVVNVWVKKDRIPQFVAATMENAKASRSEEGNLRFDFVQCEATPGKFILIEAYCTPEQKDAHKKTAHYLVCTTCSSTPPHRPCRKQKWRATVADMMEQPREGISCKQLFCPSL
eukprot:Rhum_TRINITY_DN9542_c0_g1::Rhum_TRINITY_DN9542_c0_g1_i2::g.33807::m.33807